MTVSKDGGTVMYLLVEENFDTLAEETSLPRETWEQAALYDANMGLPTPKVYVVPRKEEAAPIWRQMVGEVLDDGKLVVWPEDTPEVAANYAEEAPGRHYLVVDVTLSTEVSI